MTQPIKSFRSKHAFLSNFYPVSILNPDDLISYPSIEHAYQAMKTLDFNLRTEIRNAPTAALAKKLGRKLTVRSDWDSIKLAIMEKLLKVKFTPSTQLAKLLEETGDAELVEGNTWGDTFWGQCPYGTGYNHLGKLLMKVRAENRSKEAY